MWIEIKGVLINLSIVLKIEPVREENKLKFHAHDKIIEVNFSDGHEIDQVYFNLLALLHSKPVDGFSKQA